jgi:gliding motility-associated lipoprotein GldH
MKTVLKSSLFAAVAGFCFASCYNQGIIEKQANIPQAIWHKDSVALVVLPLDDTLAHCDMLLTLRHTDDYPYNNIILSVTATAPSGATACDTVEYLLTDGGAWSGKTGGKWIDSRLEFRNSVRLQSGEYRFQIAHLMRREKLPGVGAVGVRIERLEE